jgi:hypothetical protein
VELEKRVLEVDAKKKNFKMWVFQVETTKSIVNMKVKGIR